MIVYLQLLVMWFVLAGVIHLLVAIYARSVRRERLEKEFDATDPQGGDVAGDRDAYIGQGMADYAQGLQRRLIGVIWVLPLLIFVSVVYLVNYR